jgi:hypothetical protein
MIDGLVPVGAAVGPTLLHVDTVPPWNSALALASSASVGWLLGSSCKIRLITVGVYGASALTGGEVRLDGAHDQREREQTCSGSNDALHDHLRHAPCEPRDWRRVLDGH